MKFLFDANAVILALTGHPALLARLGKCDESDVGVSVIAFAEVALGTERGKLPPAELLDDFLEQVPLLPFDDAAARTYARLPFRRSSFDRLIAAHALSLDLTLVTANLSDFSDIPGLRVEDWTN